MRLLPAFVAVFLLAACAGPARHSPGANFDLGTVALAWQPAPPPVRSVDVVAPSWLAASAMQYRLLYADPLRRQTYAESRWAAAPSELIAHALNRRTGGACSLRLDVDDLVQVFDTPQASRVLLDVRAGLFAPNRGALLARKTFSLAQPAPTPDARGSAAATTAAVTALSGELGAWLAQALRDDPAVAERCRGH